MIDEASDSELRNRFKTLTERAVRNENEDASFQIYCVAVLDEEYETVIVQLRALGLIDKSHKPRSVRDTKTYWTLTPYGDTAMVRLRAKRRGE